MIDLCKYKDIFGKPNTGLHKYRIYNIAVIDVIATLLLAYIIQNFLLKKFNYKIEYIKLFTILVILSVLIHKIFCVNTTLTNFLIK